MRFRQIGSPVSSPRRRTRVRASAMTFEGLETRGLLSALVSSRINPLDVTLRSRLAADISSTQEENAIERSILETDIDETSAAARTTDIATEPSTVSGHGAAAIGGIERRWSPSRNTTRGPVGSLGTLLWREEPTANADSTATGAAAGSPADPVIDSGLNATNGLTLSWTIAWSRPGPAIAGDWGGGIEPRLDDDSSRSADAASRAARCDVLAYGSTPFSTPDGLDADGLRQQDSGDPFADRFRAPTVMAEVLEGAMRPDWDGVDRELRQFLAGLSGLARAGHETGTGQAWAIRIGTIAAAASLHRMAAGRRRTFLTLKVPVPGAKANRPDPIGPWPLGPP